MVKKVVIIAVIVGVIGAFALGFADKDTAIGKVRYVFFRAIGLVSAAAPGPAKPSGGVHSAKTCRENLQRLKAGKAKAADVRGNAVGNVTWEEVISAMYPNDPGLRGNTARINERTPKCPDGGTYVLNTMQAMPTCSIGGQNTATIEDDHVITQ